MLRHRLAAVLLLAGVPVAATGAARVQVIAGPQYRVSDTGHAHAEPFIAVHPQDSRRLIAAAIHFTGDHSGFVGIYSSMDGGRTWSRSHLPRLRELVAGGQMVMAADPWAGFAGDGSVYVSVQGSMNPGHVWGCCHCCSTAAAMA